MPTPNVRALLADLDLDPRVKGSFLILSDATDAAVKWLYQHCLFTVFPSLYEGWGLPVTESLNNGKFVIASNTSSIPEAGGSLAEYLDPWDVDAWADRILFYTVNREALRERESRTRTCFIPPTWDDSILEIRSEVERLSDARDLV
jgi:glycosyltransferase involved in cell wall biosynthesis